MEVMESFSSELKNTFTAAEIFSASYCNMNCKYCYIPKTEGLKEVQKQIIEALENDTFIDMLKEMYGERLTSLSFWGTEPTLTLRKVSDKMESILTTFPELKTFDFSTNLLSHYKEIINFADQLEKFGEDINFSFQISLDGPPEITDYNRHPNSTKIICKNTKDVIKTLCEREYKNVSVKINFKSTLSMDNIRSLAQNDEKMEEYAHFFETLFSEIKKILDERRDNNSEIKMYVALGISPTHVVPGSYTSLDGKVIALFYKKLDALIRTRRYKHLWPAQLEMMILNFFETLYLLDTIPSRVTCSGGDCNFGYDKDGFMHICHRMFFLNNEEYLDAIAGDKDDKENWDRRLIENSSISFIKKFYTPNKESKHDIIRFLYNMRSFHDFIKTRQEFIYVTLKELAFAGQANSLYVYDDTMAELFSLFLAVTYTCPAESLIVNGHLNSIPISLIRAFGNGAFEEAMDRYVKGFNNRLRFYLGEDK